MKKTILFIILLLVLLPAVMAQTDTIFNRCDRYHYTSWYDTIHAGRGDGYGFMLDYFWAPFNFNKYVKQEYTSEKLAVKGIAVYVMRSAADFPEIIGDVGASDSVKLPEYASLSLMNDSELVFLDSVRWDTAQPKLVQLRQTCTNLDSVAYCHSYEGYFKGPIYVEDTFFVGCTCFCNQIFSSSHVAPHYGYPPSLFMGTIFLGPWNIGYTHTPIYNYDNASGGMYVVHDHLWGLFFAIVDYDTLTVVSADSTMGIVEGGGRFSDLTDRLITAIPTEGYCFSHWSDGSVENPRIISLTQDTLLTAYFKEIVPATVTAIADNDAHGTVTGGGEYMTCDEVTLTAIPSVDCRFYSWNDGNTDNPRTFTLYCDTSFTAIFEIRVGIDDADASHAFTITPNPARDIVTVTLADGCDRAHATLVLRDALGKELRRITPSADKTAIPLQGLPAGTYLLTLTTPQGSSTQKLVIE